MTRVVFVITALALAASLSACAQQGDAPAPGVAAFSEGKEAGTIEGLEREWVAAIVMNDAATIDRLLASDFVGTSPTAHSYNKDAALADLKSGIYVVRSMDLDEVSANVYGDTAVAFTSQEEKSKYGDKDTSGHYHYTNVWVRDNGQWRVVASHGSRYDQAH